MKFLTIGRAAPLGLLLAASQAFAQSQSADVEFVRPSFGYGSFQGVDVPMVRSPKAFRYGTLIQFQRDPLTLYNADTQQEIGAVVTNRANLSFGVSVDLSERFSMNLLLPTAYNWGTEIQEFSADGFGLGDIGVGTRLIMLKTRRDAFNIGFRGGLTLPTGRQDAWLGESGVRVGAGLLAAANMGPVRLATDVGVGTRTELVTDEDFRLGTELLWGNGLRVALPAAMRTAFTAQVLMRTGFKDFLQGGAETGLEAMGGVQFLPSSNVTVDVGAGRGFNEGYGTTDMRILSQLTIQSVPKPPPPPPEPIEPPPPPPPPPPVIEDPPDPVFEEGEIAKVYLDQIIIRDKIDFIVDTNIVKDYSRPVLQALAEVINTTGQIGHLVIEGHASQEGTFEYNYALSEKRARRIWEELVKEGVHPDRISYRGMGEVVPLEGFEGEEEANLDKNRRVEFHIVHQFDTVEDMPEYPETTLLPWNGNATAITTPPRPEPEPEPEPEVDEFGLPIGPDDSFDFGDDGGEDE